MKIESQHILYLEENKFNSSKKGPQYCIISFYSKYIPPVNELVIKSTETIFTFIEGFHLPHGQISL